MALQAALPKAPATRQVLEAVARAFLESTFSGSWSYSKLAVKLVVDEKRVEWLVQTSRVESGRVEQFEVDGGEKVEISLLTKLCSRPSSRTAKELSISVSMGYPGAKVGG